MRRILDAIRRYLRYLQRKGDDLDDEIRKQVVSASGVLESRATIGQKLEIAWPLIPFLLTYRVEVGAESSMEIEEIRNQLRDVITSIAGKSD